jgi:hypothetical protein
VRQARGDVRRLAGRHRPPGPHRARPAAITIERAVEATPELHYLIGELNDVLGAAYEAHQRHGLAIAQQFDPNVRFLVVRLDGLAVGRGGRDIWSAVAHGRFADGLGSYCRSEDQQKTRSRCDVEQQRSMGKHSLRRQRC